MTGILGIYAFDERWRIASFGRYGLLALQHRGQENAGLVTLGKAFQECRGLGWVEDAISEERIRELRGHICVGQVSPNEVPEEYIQPLILRGSKPLVFTLDGRIVRIEGYRWNEELGYEANILKALSEHMEGEKDALEGFKSFMARCRGGFSFVALLSDGTMLAGRDPLGVKPLALGKIGFDAAVVASETCATDTVGERMPVSPAENIEPGELRVFTPLSARSEGLFKGCSRRAFCAFEYVYLARPDSYVNDLPVYGIRKAIGEVLFREAPAEADVVIGVPETAIPFAYSYAYRSGLPVEKGFEQTGRRVRSAIKPTQFERLKGVQLKLNVVSEAVKGRRIVLIDDSVVRGNTLANIVYLMKEKGAKEIHVRIGSPPITSPCPFGTEVPPEDELIGRHLSEERISEVVGADSFHYLTLGGLCEAIGLPRDSLCLGCFTGTYPEV